LKGEIFTAVNQTQKTLASEIEERFKALSTILKSQSDNLQNSLEATKELTKENLELKKSLAEVNERLNQYGSQSNGVRSITSQSQVVQRFAENTLNKSEDGRTSYSLKNPYHVKELTDKLTSAFELEAR